MLASLTGILLGLLVGFRHAFEPDHLAAVSTLVTETRDVRRGALLGALWGVGHTISLLVVGCAVLAIGLVVPPRTAAGFELAVAVMLVGLGLRAVRRAWRDGPIGPNRHHHHGGAGHSHAAADPHVHVGPHALALRPLAVGLVHGLAGSGALVALVFAELPSTAVRVVYMTLFGLGSVIGMAAASGLAGASAGLVLRSPRSQRAMGAAAGVLSITVGCLWGWPLLFTVL